MDKKRDDGKLSRRDFFRATALAGSVLGAQQGLTRLAQGMELKAGGAQISRTTGRMRQAVPSTCANCYARCGIFGYVEDGQLMKIGGNPSHPNNRGRLCAKGQAGVNLLYDPERVLYPLRRRGARGEGKWERISWDEALDEIVKRLNDLRQRGHPEEFVYHSERDVTTGDFARRFVHAVGSPNCLLPLSIAGANKTLAHRVTWGADFDINDVAYSDYILIFGANPFEAHVLRTSFAQRLVESRTARYFDGRTHSRAKIVTFDVRCSNTAGRSDEWHPIKPGTDGIVALAIANVIMQKGLYDREFLEKWTNYPIPKLKAHLAQFTPERAEKISGVPADDIRQIALEFATTKPATTISTGGVSKHQNGVYTERCLLLLNAITGNIDTRGGCCLPRHYTFFDPPPIPPQPASGLPVLMNPPDLPLVHHGVAERLPSLVVSGELKVGVYMTYQANPAYSSPECDDFAALLKNEELIPFYVAVDSFMSESAMLADIVLPAATYLERWELDSPPAFSMTPFVSLRQPVVKPLGESRAFTDIVLALAQRLGPEVNRYFPFASTEDYLRACLARIDKLIAAGGLEYLREKGFWFDPAAKPDYQRYRREGFNTPSGKFEIYSTELARHGYEPLPTYVPLPQHELKSDEFYMTTFQWNVHTHFHTANCMFLSEIVHANPLWINVETAEALGIGHGDRVRVTSKAGSFVTQAWVTQGIHPKVVAASDSCGHWGYGHIAQAEPFKSSDPETSLVWWEEEGNGAHPNPAIAIAIDPVGGGQGWMDTVVCISKA